MTPPPRRTIILGVLLGGGILLLNLRTVHAAPHSPAEPSTPFMAAEAADPDSFAAASAPAIYAAAASAPDSLDPKRILRSSLLVPGLGQIRNGQWWKVPVIYAVLGTAVKYTSDLTVKYHDYRAAVYNLSLRDEGDGRFGPTPGYISPNSDLSQLKRVRDQFRNRRDFMFIAIGLLHGLNGVDAFVHAHMREFDVSDDLSASFGVQPALDPLTGVPVPSLTLTLRAR